MFRALILILLLAVPAFATEYGKVSVHKVASDVYLFTTTPYGVGLSGNSVAIINQDHVVVFDSNGLPETAQTILKEIRKITDRPVRYLINSHWHWDHWAGNQVYQEAYPKVSIVAQENTLRQMMEVEPRWNDQGLKEGLPQYLKSLEEKLASAKQSGKPEADWKELESLVSSARNFLTQKTSLKKTYPTVTFGETLTISGPREIRISHARAITIGDAYLYLPKERILITGDILLHPYPFAIGGAYPADWLSTLEKFAALKPAIIIPGHGPVQEPDYIKKNVELFQAMIAKVKEAKNGGASLEQTREQIGKQASQLAALLGISEEQTISDFKNYFLDVFVTRAYRELQGPLGDLPDGLPGN